MSIVKPSAILIVVLLLAACAAVPPPVRQLNEPSRSQPQGENNVLYETIEKNGIAVGYTLLYINKSKNLTGYRLGIILRNNRASTQVLTPIVSIQDADGFLIQPYDYQTFASRAASLAGTEIPPPPQVRPRLQMPSTYNSQGTITSPNGTSTFNATTTANPSLYNGSSQLDDILAQREARQARSDALTDRQDGNVMLQMANVWLKNEYQLPTGAAVKGLEFFPAPSMGPLPLKVVIEVGGQSYGFTTLSK